MARIQTSIVHALVNNQYVAGYQVHVATLTMDANGVTVLAAQEERIPAGHGVTMEEAKRLEHRAKYPALYAVRDSLAYLDRMLSEHTSKADLELVEGYLCHVTNRVAGTPCHPACLVCGDPD